MDRSKAETEVSLIVEPNNNCLYISRGKTELTLRSSQANAMEPPRSRKDLCPAAHASLKHDQSQWIYDVTQDS